MCGLPSFLDLSTGTEECLQLPYELDRIERRGEDVPNTRSEALVPLSPAEIGRRGDDEGGSIVYRGQFSDCTAGVETRGVGQFVVNDDEVGLQPGGYFCRLPTGIRLDDRVARRSEDALDRPRGPLLVVDEKHEWWM